MNYRQRIEHSREIIEQNRYLIYHLPREYENLDRVLRHQGIKDTLLKIFKYIKDKEIFIYRRKYVFFLDNKRLTQLREKTTESVSNRYINYLCAVGFINKEYQNLGEFGNVDTTKLTDINLGFLLETNKRRPINTFFFRAYDTKELKRLDSRAKQLLDNNISPGNISFNMLSVNNCRSLADEVYYSNDRNSIKNKEQAYMRLLEAIESLIDSKGYACKKELDQADKLLKIFKADFRSKYNYKAQSKKDREQYKIPQNYKGWIITRR